MNSMANTQYDNSLVSVIIPTYNSAKYLEKTVQSVLKQTYKNIEIIIVDDCSKDNTEEIVRALSDRDCRIRYVLQSQNGGAAVARNTGIALAKGRYIAFLDSDDYWEDNKIIIQLHTIRKGHPFVFCSYDTVDVNGLRIAKPIKIKKRVKYSDLMTKTYISTPTVMYDRVFFHNPSMPLRRTGQDYAFWLVLLKKSEAYGIDFPLVHVTKRGGSLSKNKFQSLKDVYETQTVFEGIPKVKAAIHTVAYFVYAVKKKIIDK